MARPHRALPRPPRPSPVARGKQGYELEDDPWRAPHDGPGRRVAALWLSVMYVALADAARPGDGKGGVGLQRQQARSWLTTRSRDLDFVLAACGVDEGFWHQRVVPELLERWRQLDAAGPTPPRPRAKPGEGTRRRRLHAPERCGYSADLDPGRYVGASEGSRAS